MIRVAIILTVFNRREITLNGLRSLKKSILALGGNYSFDIYMTDDGCNDGTSEAVANEFSDILIIKGNGSLFWGGGMRMAWKTALKSSTEYDYFLWFNDDVDLYDNALIELFEHQDKNSIIVGAFCNHQGQTSYGGKNGNTLICPIGITQKVELMNGNLVLVPNCVYKTIGMIDKRFLHGEGDYDYGLRAKRAGFQLLLTSHYVGIAERHDEFIPKCYSKDISFRKRWMLLHNPIYSPTNHFYFNMKYKGIMSALYSFIICYLGVISPSIYERIKMKFR